jgi:AcrR family transcriptional regulator
MTETGARTRRPRDRKTQILAAAAERFHRYGYHATSMEDIARAVGITAGALYRHFSGKQELLSRVLLDGADLLHQATSRAKELDGLLRAIAAFSLDHSEYAALLDRETRALSAEQRAVIKERLRGLIVAMGSAVRARRPGLSRPDAELVAVAAIGVLVSPSYHHMRLPRLRFEDLLWELAAAVCHTTALPASGEAPESGGGLTPVSRREALLFAGIALFKERGYQAVSMEDIGATAGISGPSVYKHFAGKADLLAAVLRRQAEAAQFALAQALAESPTAEAALARVLRAFVALTAGHGGTAGLSMADVSYLSPADQRALSRARTDYLAEWVALLMATRPDLEAIEARMRVHTMFTMVAVVAQAPHLERPATPDILTALALDVLGVSVS